MLELFLMADGYNFFYDLGCVGCKQRLAATLGFTQGHSSATPRLTPWFMFECGCVCIHQGVMWTIPSKGWVWPEVNEAKTRLSGKSSRGSSTRMAGAWKTEVAEERKGKRMNWKILTEVRMSYLCGCGRVVVFSYCSEGNISNVFLYKLWIKYKLTEVCCLKLLRHSDMDC